MRRNVVVVSHADADGHVIGEQVRRNLEVVPNFDVRLVVDPNRTKDHKAWLHLDALPELESADLVFFVDLMFAPTSFAAEADALVTFACDRPKKRIFLIDHHPLPLRRLASAPNVRATYRQDVMDCSFGPASWMMVLAALCEKQPTRAKSQLPAYKVMVKALRRAAAPGTPLSGEKLATLLKFDCWKQLEQLGLEDATEHYLPRGRRAAGTPLSPALAELDATATRLLRTAEPAPHHPLGEAAMPYDFEAATDRTAPVVKTAPAQADDLEAIVVLLELAAINLTPQPGTEFTFAQLMEEARDLGGEDAIDEKDVKIVLEKASFIKKQGKHFILK